MKKKFGFLMKLGLAVVAMVIIASCLKNDDDQRTYSAAEEIADRNAYLNELIKAGYDVDTLDNTIYYVVIDEGEGPFVQLGDSISIGYAGYLIDGRLFDGSERYSFVFEEGDFITGWERALKIMNEGARIQFVIPSELAYGSTGAGPIPPYQSLIFVIKLIKNHSIVE